jgi:predicted nucleic-acid-binding protein
MIGLDTNILVRYLTHDDPVQARKAIHLIERELDEDNPGFICLAALVETVWVLENIYDLTTEEVSVGVERILQSTVLVVQNEQQVYKAIIAMQERRGSFMDVLISALGERADCEYTLTFDKQASRLAGFKLMS